jgi:proton-translocating NADH-quinone oxidoreductase chain L
MGSFDFVGYVWLIPALPLAAVILNFLVVRPIYLATQPKQPSVAGNGHGGHGGHDAHASESGQQAEDTSPDAHGVADDHGAGHDDHGGATPFWGSVGGIVGVIALLLSFLLSLGVLFQFLNTPALVHDGRLVPIYTWFSFGALNYPIDFRVDTLTVVMLIVVTGVSFLVHLYSIGYMAGDPGYIRFYIELSLFTVAMLILVLAANFLVIFIGWELVGLSSYLLIGFWFYHSPPPPGSEVPYPPPASLKAFVTTRLGDFGFLIGILILFTAAHTFDFVALNNSVNGPSLAVNKTTITVAMILVFCGAIGKSAQFPLHTWLPDAMAGPTPVSALIHAATMVAAGVYLVARLFPLYHAIAGPEALQVVGYIGAFTALFAATIALTQNDIKGVLAYSTISQLGYMFTGLAVGETNTLGMYHLFTHAFFKALLFLGSGSVIHAISQQDMRKMGGLAKYLPWTAGTLLVANLAIAGIPPFSGFWSKDPIIAAAWEHQNYLIYGMTGFTAVLTAFYMFRLYFLTFGGRGGAWGGLFGGQRQYRGEGHPHGESFVMVLPLVILAVTTIVIGIVSIPQLGNLNVAFAQFLNNGTPVDYPVSPALDGLTIIGVAAAIVGIGTAWAIYGLGIVPANVLTRNPVGAGVYRVLKNRYYLDEFYALLIRYVVIGLSQAAAGFDKYVIDGVVNGTALLVRGIGNITRRSETGELQNYGAALFGGAIIILLVIFFATGAIGK